MGIKMNLIFLVFTKVVFMEGFDLIYVLLKEFSISVRRDFVYVIYKCSIRDSSLFKKLL